MSLRTQVKQFLGAAIAMLVIPFALLGLSIFTGLSTGLSKLQQQGWKYFVPTWKTIAELVSLLGLIGFLGVALYAARQGYNAYLAALPSMIVVLGSIFLATEVERMEERTGRQKVFQFAEVEDSTEA